MTGIERETWLKALVPARASMDYRCNELHGHQDSEEEKTFLNELTKTFGPWIFQAIECQRPFKTITNLPEGEEFYDQRLDFCIDTGNTKIIIEIDGQQHLEQKQSLLDKRRDTYLQNNGWDVIRIPAWKVREKNFSETLERLEKCFNSDPILKLGKESFVSINTGKANLAAALLLVLTPIAIARIQWVLNWALLKGKINLDNSIIRLAIVEDDVPCAILAVWDFISSLEHLRYLAGVEFALPAVELEIIASKDFTTARQTIDVIPEKSGFKVHLSNIDQADTILNYFDLIIINSTLHVGPKSFNLKLGQNNWVAINSVFSPRGTSPRFNSTAPIDYKCNGKSEDLQFFLQWIFRKKQFLPGQIEIIERALGNKDVIGLLPTGAGKSLCYQLSALLEPGMTLIVDPIVSLMNDQIDNLKRLQIDSIANISSDLNFQERSLVMDRMCNRNLLMLYISPERLQISEFREKLANMCQHTLVPYLVIDESHCVSEWGHDFRPAYLRLADNAKKFCLYREYKPTVIGLTGTASWDVLTDIQREIDINEDEAIITPKTFDRAELEYEVIKCNSNNKSSILISKILELPQKFENSPESFFTNENAGIIFCPHVNGQYGITAVASQILKELPDVIKKVGTFGGTAPENYTTQLWKETKLEHQRERV